MSKEKQIEEMALDICKSRLVAEDGDACRKCRQHNNCLYQEIAYGLYNAGYRKQSEGEWLQGVNNSKVCSICGKEPLYTASGTAFATTFYRVKSNYCPNCGARMKGGAEQRFFSPKDVQRMTRTEVRDNYQAIMESMRKWK